MLPQWATRAFRSSESHQPRERLQSMLGCPLVLKGSKLAAFRAVEGISKNPRCIVPPFDSIPLVARIKSRKEADQVVLPPLNSEWPDGEWPISLD